MDLIVVPETLVKLCWDSSQNTKIQRHWCCSLKNLHLLQLRWHQESLELYNLFSHRYSSIVLLFDQNYQKITKQIQNIDNKKTLVIVVYVQGSGRPQPTPSMLYRSCLIPKDQVPITILVWKIASLWTSSHFLLLVEAYEWKLENTCTLPSHLLFCRLDQSLQLFILKRWIQTKQFQSLSLFPQHLPMLFNSFLLHKRNWSKYISTLFDTQNRRYLCSLMGMISQ
jgi:hypothetical protein